MLGHDFGHNPVRRSRPVRSSRGRGRFVSWLAGFIRRGGSDQWKVVSLAAVRTLPPCNQYRSRPATNYATHRRDGARLGVPARSKL